MALGIASVLSAVIGVLALILALVANSRAKDAPNESRRQLAAERKRTFELGLLDEFVGALSDKRKVRHGLTDPREFGAALMVRLSMLPPDDLPEWRKIMDSTLDELTEHFSATPEELARLQKQRQTVGARVPDSTFNAAYEALLRDIQAAVGRRMSTEEVTPTS